MPDEPEQPAPPPPEPPGGEPEHYPFWGYSDLLLFIGLLIPCVLLATGIVRGVFAIVRVNPGSGVLLLLPQQLLGYGLIFGVLALILRLQYDRPFWRSLAWSKMRIQFGWIVISGLICALGVAWVGTLIQTPTKGNPMTQLMQDRASLIFMAIFGVTLAPVCEELAFRGFLQPLLVRSLGTLPGILLASVPFGFLHYREYGNSWRHALLIGLAGASFGWMRHVTGSTKASSLMHASYNGMIFLAVFSAKVLHH
jgi:uncharacterized protein